MYPMFTQEVLAVLVVLVPLVLVVGLAVTYRIRQTMAHQFRCLEGVLKAQREAHLNEVRARATQVVHEVELRQEHLEEVMRKSGHVL